MSDLPEGMVLDTEAKRLAGIRFLNARLPKKRLIAQGVLRSPDGRLLLCELTYKRDWDLPGGVVDPGESPATCVVREIEEELGLAVTVHGLLAVNWLPPYRGWDDALLCLFDLGTVDAGVIENEGVPPDVTVEETPQTLLTGHDPQLEKAIELAMQALKAQPSSMPQRPPYPNRVTPASAPR